MGRGKRAGKRPAPSLAKQSVFATPPWPQEMWSKPGMFVSDLRLRDRDELCDFISFRHLEPSLENAWAVGVAAVVSGTSFDNAMGTHPYGEGGEFQELSVYLTFDGEPNAELNLANLCAWVTSDIRGQRRDFAAGTRLFDAGDLAAFADSYDLRRDWHEPDESEITARARGRLLDRGSDALAIELCRYEYVASEGDYFPGETLAEVHLIDLLAWAAGWERPEPKLEAGPRLRPSGLASRVTG